MKSIEDKLSNLSLKAPWLSALILLVFVVFSLWGLKSLTFNVDASVYYDRSQENYRIFKDLEDTYGKSDNVILILDAKEGALYSQKNLALLEDLTNKAWLIPYVTRVDSITNHNHSWSEGDEMYVEALAENAQALTADEIKNIKHIALSSPELVNRLTTTESEMALIRLTLALPLENKQDAEIEVALAAHKIAEALEANNPDIDILLSGGAIHNHETNAILAKDITKYMPLMYAAIFVLLGLMLKSVSAMFMVFVVTILSCLSAFGLASWFGISINTMSISAVNIIITVTIAHCVHIQVGFSQFLNSGKEKIEAIKESLSLNMIPVTLTSLTTMLGFLSMNLSKMPPARDLGDISALGVVIAYLLTIFLIPLLQMILPFKGKASNKASVLSNFMERLGSFVIKRKITFFMLAILFSVVMLPMASTNVMNDRFTESIKMPNQYRSDNAQLDKYFGGMYSIEYNFKAGDKGGISSPEYLLALDKFSDWLRQQPNVRNVHAYSDLVKRLNQNMHGDAQAFYTIPETREEAAQYQLLYEMSQPFGSDMNNTITPQKDATRLIVSLPSTDTNDLIALHQDASAWIKENMPSYMHISGGSLSVLWAYLGQEAIADGIKGGFFALFLISIILTVVFRSIKLGLISLVPNLLPMAFGYGLWSMTDGEITMIQMLVMSLTIGIVVDDTVHFLSKYIRAKNTMNYSADEAVHYAFKAVGPALWITTVVLVAGFGMMLGSSFIPNADMGLLTIFILVSALFLDFFMLPPLLMLFDKKKNANTDDEHTRNTKDHALAR